MYLLCLRKLLKVAQEFGNESMDCLPCSFFSLFFDSQNVKLDSVLSIHFHLSLTSFLRPNQTYCDSKYFPAISKHAVEIPVNQKYTLLNKTRFCIQYVVGVGCHLIWICLNEYDMTLSECILGAFERALTLECLKTLIL